MTWREAVLPTAIFLTIVLGLWADKLALPWVQPALSLWVTALFLFLLTCESPRMRSGMLVCLLVAACGEALLSLVWGLYRYRLGNLPLFVPPGHVLLFWFGLQTVDRVPAKLLEQLVPIFVLVVSTLAVIGHDWLGVPLLLVFLACWRWGSAPRLYVWMFLLAWGMELWGTYASPSLAANWTWRATVPALGWPTMNPPFAAGAFYCLLDALVQGTVMRLALKFRQG